ncbi:SOS response-associated peptidase [Pseudorhizobium endolithicum]|uniref:Abasic site processing protein n=1 Tax=Pseudorhizobium endolithicum TaxID=1191678 RepID=A0ABM8PR30_9HYPH|nr:SOS response-associated peptidase [Pseudorhizobium endolithicum]CAD7043916.1 SOS response-associated peptidase [Pseudorhizobium endolithicum]
MCGRYALTATSKEVLDFLGVIDIDDFPARYNIAPTQPVLVVAAEEHHRPGSNLPRRRALLARWGFLPGWVKDVRDFPLLINARAETAPEKASFRGAMRHRRVLVPASGFYEWRRPAKETGLPAQPYWIRSRKGGLVAFGGLMETYASADGSEMDTAAILTTRANATLRGIHDRMPVVIPPQEFSRWLDCRTQEPREVADLLQPAPEELFEAVPVSNLVNRVANMGPELQKPIILAEPQDPPPKAAAQMSLF